MNLFAFILYFLVILRISSANNVEQCKKADFYWQSIKFPYSNIKKYPDMPSSVAQCSQNPSSTPKCCNSKVLAEMTSVSTLKLKEVSQEKLEGLLVWLSNDSYVLMNIFQTDLEGTKKQLNKMFSSTYGYNYKVHRQFFYSWFEKLQQYMRGEIHNIGQLLDNFFLEMAQRIVRILIPQGASAQLTACHTDRLIEARPYQNTDESLRDTIVKSYPPARLTANALAVARDTVETLLKRPVNPSAKCIEDYNAAFHCMICQGRVLKSCPDTCASLLTKCLGFLSDTELRAVDKVFNKFQASLILLVARLDNPFNFPQVNHKMSVQISTAIMSVQQVYPKVKEKIIQKCRGVSRHRQRKKRQVAPELYEWMGVQNNPERPIWERNLEEGIGQTRRGGQSGGVAQGVPDYQSKPSDLLSPFARKIKQRYLAQKNYFQKIPSSYCSDVITAKTTCWNGTIEKSMPPEAMLNDGILSAPGAGTRGKKASSRKKAKTNDPQVNAILKRLQDITKKMNLFLKGKNLDPDTMPVKAYTVFKPKRAEKPVQENKLQRPDDTVEGSGGGSGGGGYKLPFPPPRLNPERPQPEPQPQPRPRFPEVPVKPQPPWSQPESGPDAQLPIKPKQTTTKRPPPGGSSSRGISTLMPVTPTGPNKPLIVNPNEIPDDEDLNPGPIKPGPINPGQPPKESSIEGSGHQAGKTVPPPSIDGSGSGTPRDPVPEPSKPRLPVPPSQPVKPPLQPSQPDLEGSGANPQPLPPQNKLPDGPVVIPFQPPQQSTPPQPGPRRRGKPYPPPPNYPGKIPPEVWIPEVGGVRRDNNLLQQSTPGGTASRSIPSLYSSLVCSLLAVFWLNPRPRPFSFLTLVLALSQILFTH